MKGSKLVLAGLVVASMASLTACHTFQGTVNGAREDVRSVVRSDDNDHAYYHHHRHHMKHHHMMNNENMETKSTTTKKKTRTSSTEENTGNTQPAGNQTSSY